MGNNENDLSDNIYEQLQKILNECIELGYKPEGNDNCNGCQCYSDVIDFNFYIQFARRYTITMSYHDLFSKDSGIMERMEWKSGTDVKQEYSNAQHNREWHYKRMCMITAEQKVQYFISNAIVPNKK